MSIAQIDRDHLARCEVQQVSVEVFHPNGRRAAKVPGWVNQGGGISFEMPLLGGDEDHYIIRPTVTFDLGEHVSPDQAKD